MAFADELREAVRTERMRRRMTQADAAALVGRTGKWLSEYELGKKEASVAAAVGLAEALGLELSVTAPETVFSQVSGRGALEKDIKPL